ncbi:MAG: TonB family protein [Burkholderiales bacterium]
MHPARADQRVLLACLVISILLHAWLLSGVATDRGADSRRAFDASPAIQLSLEAIMPQLAPALPEAAAHELARVGNDRPTRIEKSALPPPKREVPDSPRPTKGAAQPPVRPGELAFRDARADSPAITTADQYRFALVMQARREQGGRRAAGGLEGRTRVRLDFADGGGLQSTKVIASSGHDSLDAEALRLFDEAHQKLPVPQALLERRFSIEATVSFERD